MRRFVKFLVSLIAVALLATATLPWWWGAALRMGGARAGLDFGDYERVGYTRWSLTDVVWAGSPGQFTARRIELPHPILLALRGSEAGSVRIEKWHWQQAASEHVSEAAEQDPGGWAVSFQTVNELMSWVPNRIPIIEAIEGALDIESQQVTLNRLHWNPTHAQLSFSGVNVKAILWAGEVRWNTETSVLSGRVSSTDGGAQFTMTAERAELDGTWWQQPLRATATFSEKGWRPDQAEITAEEWTLAGSRVGLAGRYESVQGTARALWEEDQFKVSLTVDGEPVAGKKLPRLQIETQAHGSLDQLIIDALKASAPGMEAHLSKAVTFGRRDWTDGWNTPATFTVATDLAVLSDDQVSGKLEGQVELIPTESVWPQLHAKLQAASMRWKDWPEVSGEIAATFDGQHLQVDTLEISADDRSHLEASGGWNVKSQTATEVKVQGKIARRWVSRWLPVDANFSEIELSGTANGRWPDLDHQGTLQVDEATMGILKPSGWKLDWEGMGREVKSTLKGVAGQSEFTVVSTASSTELIFEAITLQRADGAELKMVSPAKLTLKPEFNIEPLRLEGPDDGVTIALGSGSRWHVEGSRLEQAWVDDWMTLPDSVWFVESLLVDGRKVGETWQGRVDSRLAVGMGEDRSAQITLQMHLDDEGIRIEQGDVSEGEKPILNVTGTIPFTINPDSPDEILSFDPEETMSLQITSADNPVFWEQLHQAVGLKVERPVLNGTISGSWEQPAGEIAMGADLIRLDPKRWGTRWPEMRRLQVHVSGSDEGLVLDGLTARISGQEVRASGLLPLDKKKLTLLRDDPWAYLRQAGNGKIEIPGADLSAWATLAPTVLAPLGRLQMSLQVAPGGMIDGTMHLEGAATRPIGPLGALQDIVAEVRFAGRRVTIESVEAQTGGRPVELKGEARWLDSGQPRFDLSLQGKNLPFIRQTGLLLRGDVDLKLQTDDNGVTWVRGGVGLRDGLFLVDLESLRPGRGGGGSGAGRPPYFSVKETPFAEWRVDLEVKGNNFLRMETPVFSGRASANFQLMGTLREPRAIGEAELTQGLVKLPFATFNVTEGRVQLLQSDPHELRLSVIGNARRLDYDLRMELTGTGSSPNLQFYSNPPLSSEEVLLLVMAGEPPRSDVEYSSAQRATKLGAYLGRNLINQFTGNQDREERLMISLGEKVSQGGKETYQIEYYLNGRWSLVGEYDEFDDYNAGVKWKVFSSRKEKEADDEK